MGHGLIDCAKDARGLSSPRPSNSHHAIVLGTVLPTVDADRQKGGKATVLNGFVEHRVMPAGEE